LYYDIIKQSWLHCFFLVRLKQLLGGKGEAND